MAKKGVKSFTVKLEKTFVFVEIHTENKRPYRYEIYSDTRQQNLGDIAKHLENGLEDARINMKKIDVSDYSERSYVHIVTPLERHSNQYTAKKV